MPKIAEIQGGEGVFTFSGAGLEKLEAPEYTLVTIAIDTSGSVRKFKDELQNAIASIQGACNHSPRADNLLVRLSEFGDGSVKELAGFAPFAELEVPELQPDGPTPLYDGIYDALVSISGYTDKLYDADYLVNAIVIVITDGMENDSQNANAQKIKDKLRDLRNSEALESLRVILIGINQGTDDRLQELVRILGLDQYVDIGEADANNLAKMARFVSRSIEAQSQALGSGGPSQEVSLTL